jgi:hypothetical protein
MLMRGRSVLLIGTGQVALHIDGPLPSEGQGGPDDVRGLGSPRESEARKSEESLRRIAAALQQRFDFVAGAVFPHDESQHE